MANTTQGKGSIHGTNPQYLIEKVIRSRIYDSPYWKEHCFALNSASIIDNALALDYVGGTFANQKPTQFLCLVLKLLQLQPEREIVLEYLRAEEFKSVVASPRNPSLSDHLVKHRYLRALAAFYVRLTFDSLNVYQVLEPLLDDYRKVRFRGMDGSYTLTTMDEFVDSLLSSERVCEIQLPRLTQRKVLEETEGLMKRKSKLGKALGVLDGQVDEDEDEDEDENGEREERYMSRSPSNSRSPSPEIKEGLAGEQEFWTEGSEDEEEEEGEKGRYISRSPSVEAAEEAAERFVSRSPSPASDLEMQEGGAGGT